MSDQGWRKEELDGFREGPQSLRRYRRAELQDEGQNKSLVKNLYVDPSRPSTFSKRFSSPERPS